MRAAVPREATARSSTDLRVAALFSEFEPRLRQALFAFAGPHDLDDAIGETFAHLCANADRVLAMTNPRGYLYRVARDNARGRRRLDPDLPAVPADLQPDVHPELVPALARLTPKQRTSVYLSAGLGWSWVEIADFLGTTPSTVRNHYRRGIEKVRNDIGGGEP